MAERALVFTSNGQSPPLVVVTDAAELLDPPAGPLTALADLAPMARAAGQPPLSAGPGRAAVRLQPAPPLTGPLRAVLTGTYWAGLSADHTYLFEGLTLPVSLPALSEAVLPVAGLWSFGVQAPGLAGITWSGPVAADPLLSVQTLAPVATPALAVDPLPAETRQSRVTITGSAPGAAEVWAGPTLAVVGADGAFTATVALALQLLTITRH